MTITFTRPEAEHFAALARRRGIPWASLSRNEADARCVLRAAMFLYPQEESGQDASERFKEFLRAEGQWLKAAPEQLQAATTQFAGAPKPPADEALANPEELRTLLTDLAAQAARRQQKIRAALQAKNRQVNAPTLLGTASTEQDEERMERALTEAKKALAAGEVPVGAVLVLNNQVLACTQNRVCRDKDPTAHAEILAIRAACSRVGSERLTGSILYVTLEPCPMCAAAIANARIARVVWGAGNPLSGGMGGTIDVAVSAHLNHRARGEGGVLAAPAQELLTTFFAAKRTKP